MSLNKVMLIGNLGNDPEIRYTNGGDAVTNATLATNKKYRDKSNNLVDKTEWHRLVFFKQLAETVAKHLAKGSMIYVEGEIQTNKWQDKDGNDRYTTDIICKEMKMLGGKNANSGGNNNSTQTTNMVNNQIDESDDIPF